METLSCRLGVTSHCSALLRRLGALGFPDANSLMRLAIQRGCRYYEGMACGTVVDPGMEKISNEDLAIGLLHGGLEWSPAALRMGAAMLGARGNDPRRIARLARMERCEDVVREVARAGSRVEPANEFWSNLLGAIPPRGSVPPGVLPHWTRFVAMTGMSREGIGVRTQWIRPGGAHG